MLQVNVKRSIKGRDSAQASEIDNQTTHMAKSLKTPVVRKGKLVVVDLAGSERIDKSGNWISYGQLSFVVISCQVNCHPSSLSVLFWFYISRGFVLRLQPICFSVFPLIFYA